MKQTILAIVLAFAVSAQAQANSSVIFGQDAFGNVMGIPNTLCASPGQEVRLSADVLDFAGRRGFLPAEAFVWRLTRSNGFWEQWDASLTVGYGPFRRGFDVQNSVYVRIPFDVGPNARLESVGRGAGVVARIQIVDPNSTFPPAYCQWGPAQIYLGAPAPEPTPTPTPEPSPVPPSHIYPCYGQCVVDALCSDGCPWGATCTYTPGGVPVWQVISCPAR